VAGVSKSRARKGSSDRVTPSIDGVISSIGFPSLFVDRGILVPLTRRDSWRELCFISSLLDTKLFGGCTLQASTPHLVRMTARDRHRSHILLANDQLRLEVLQTRRRPECMCRENIVTNTSCLDFTPQHCVGYFARLYGQTCISYFRDIGS